MKKLVAGIAFMMLMALGVNAQDKHEGHKKQKGKHHKEHFTKELNLTDGQKDQMKSIQADYRGKMKDLKKNENITVKEMKEKRKALAKENKTAMNNILTAEQKTKMQDLRKKSTEKRTQASAKKMAKLKTSLGLTEQQEVKMKSLQDNHKSKISELRKNESIDQAAKKQQIMTLNKQHKEELKKVLSPAQIEKMKELRQNKEGKNRTR